MIEEKDYWMGRDKTNASELTDEIRANAAETIRRANLLLGVFLSDYPQFEVKVDSGWRPAAVNAAIPNAAKHSKHMTGQAVDIADPDGILDNWCVTHLNQLENIGLWLEFPGSTKNWCHIQTVQPMSGNRVFYP